MTGEALAGRPPVGGLPAGPTRPYFDPPKITPRGGNSCSIANRTTGPVLDGGGNVASGAEPPTGPPSTARLRTVAGHLLLTEGHKECPGSRLDGYQLGAPSTIFHTRVATWRLSRSSTFARSLPLMSRMRLSR